MNLLEIEIGKKSGGGWPTTFALYSAGSARRRSDPENITLDWNSLNLHLPTDAHYGEILGRALFGGDPGRGLFGEGLLIAASASSKLRVVLKVAADELSHLRWDQLQAPFAPGNWNYLALNRSTPFSIQVDSLTKRSFPDIDYSELRALILVADIDYLSNHYDLDGFGFDMDAAVQNVTNALDQHGIQYTVLATVDGSNGEPSLEDLVKHLDEGLNGNPYTLLHIVCHGRYRNDKTVLYVPRVKDGKFEDANYLIERMDRLRRLPHFAFLSLCDSAKSTESSTTAEEPSGSLAHRMVRELGMPVVLAMVDKVQVDLALELSKAFYPQFLKQDDPEAEFVREGLVDLALSDSLLASGQSEALTVPMVLARDIKRPIFITGLEAQRRRKVTRRVTVGLLLIVALLVAGALDRMFFWPERQVQQAKIQFSVPNSTEDSRLEALALLASQPGRGDQVGDPAEEATALFFERYRNSEAQARFFGSFDGDDVNVNDLSTVIGMIAPNMVTSDTFRAADNTEVLRAMVGTLGAAIAEQAPEPVETDVRQYHELDFWIQARKHAVAGMPELANEAYDQAIEVNENNPATRFERAQIRAHLKPLKYEDALVDLEQTLSILAGQLLESNEPPEAGGRTLAGPIRWTPEAWIGDLLEGNRKLAQLLAASAVTYPRVAALQTGGPDLALNGPVQVTLNWTGPQDLDLWLETELGTRIAYDRPSAEGWRLDMDANGLCSEVADWPQERIVYTDGQTETRFEAGASFSDTCLSGDSVNYALTVLVDDRQFTHEGILSKDEEFRLSDIVPGWIGREWIDERREIIPPPSPAPTYSVVSLAFTHDGRRLVAGGSDMMLYDMEENLLGTRLPPWQDSDPVEYRSLAISPDDFYIVAGAADNLIYRWRTSMSSASEPLEGHTEAVNAVAFSADGDRFYSAAASGVLQIWDARRFTAEVILPVTPAEIRQLALSADGFWMATISGDLVLELWDLGDDGSEVTLAWRKVLPGPVQDMVFGPESDLIAVATEVSVQIYDPLGRSQWRQDRTDVKSLTFGTPNCDRFFLGTDLGQVEAWDSVGWQQLHVFQGVEDTAVTDLAAATGPDGKLLAASFVDGQIYLWALPD